MQVSNHIFGSTDARDWRSVSKEIFLCNNLAHLPRHISSESTVEITVWAYLSESTVEQRAYQIKERGQNPSNCISVWFSQLFKQMCLYKIIPSHSCFTYSRGSVSAKYSPVTFDTVQLLPRRDGHIQLSSINQSFIYHEGRRSPEQLAEEEQSTSSS